jgi:hypothetical protein
VGPSFSGGCVKQSGNLGAAELSGYNWLSLQEPNRLQATVSPSWNGGCAIRVEAREGDFDSNATDRAEISGTHTVWSAGQEVWYSMSFMLAAGSPMPPSSGWMLVHQFYAQDRTRWISGGSPPLSLEVQTPGGIYLKVRGGAKASEGTNAPRNSQYRLGEAAPGTWHELLFHVRWSVGSEGLVEVWQRQTGQPFSSSPEVVATGPNVLTVAGDVLPVYAETGVYRSRVSTAQVVDYGGLWARPTRVAAEGFFPQPHG